MALSAIASIAGIIPFAAILSTPITPLPDHCDMQARSWLYDNGGKATRNQFRSHTAGDAIREFSEGKD